ncbi:MAG: hypothetical protein A3J79_02955 [Elusimicrobia bacterium RIFOXYB2_FULL_62_6]|nr:MAG: hypothetical protein A3J79_02955 [Elusimicrobia bacterium RIFOXYB2_FULL_62_6]
MRAAKKYRVKVRLKVRNRIARKTGAIVAGLACAALIGYGAYRARGLAAAAGPVEFFSFTAKELEVKSPSDVITADISALVKPRLGRRFTRADAKNLERVLRVRYPSMKRSEVRRSLLGGRVTVTAEAEPVVARVRLLSARGGGGEFYLAENGRLLGETYGAAPADGFETSVYAEPGEVLAPLAVFLKELKGLSEEFSSRPVALRYRRPEGACQLTLENDAEVFWGELEFTRSKVAKLNEVVRDAAQKISGPLKIDFRYFRDGKVFVSKTGNI